MGSYGYGAKPHATTSAGSNRYLYDPSGNMTSRREGGITYTQNFNIDNKLTSVSGNNQAWRFVYNADGELAKRIDASGTTVFVGNYFERTDPSKRTGQVFVPSTQKSYGSYWKIEATTPSTTKYYFFGGQRVAMRVNDGAPTYLHSDNIGSTSLTTNNGGSLVSQTRYTPFGSVRSQTNASPTNYTFTGQRDEGFGLLNYNARHYDPVLGRFISADTITAHPGYPQDLNRYGYVHNNPLLKTDPTGHIAPLIVLGIIGLGALIGGSIGIGASVIEQQREFASVGKSFDISINLDVDRTARTALVGVGIGILGGAAVVAGGLIGAGAIGMSGIASAETAAMGTTALAGTINSIGNVSGYLFASGDQAKVDDAVVAGGWGFVNGAGVQAFASTPSGSLVSLRQDQGRAGLVGGLTLSGEYSSKAFIHQQNWNFSDAAFNFILGTGVNAIDRRLFGPSDPRIDIGALRPKSSLQKLKPFTNLLSGFMRTSAEYVYECTPSMSGGKAC